MRAGIRLVFPVGTQYLQEKSFAWIWSCTESDPSRGLLPLKTIGRASKEVVPEAQLGHFGVANLLEQDDAGVTQVAGVHR